MNEMPPLQRLTKDLKEAAITLSDVEARYLVDSYYMMQENRKRADNQVRQMAAEPHSVIAWLAAQSSMLEGQIQRALDAYSASKPIGTWMRANHGIGPVIAAGLMAHIDINRAVVVGHIWRFAGLDPSVEWKSADYTRGFIAATRKEKGKGNDWAALIHACHEAKRRPLDVLKQAGILEFVPGPEEIRKYLSEKNVDKILKAEFHADNMLREALDAEGLEVAYEDLCRGMEFDWKEITRVLTRRPWNAELKTLCWKIGQGFMKFSNADECFYGKLYRERKLEQTKKNETGGNKALAAELLPRYKETTDAYKQLQQGKLPLAQIDGRARRHAVKMFLAHVQQVWWFMEKGELPPKPFVIEHLGHSHYIAPRHLDLVPGMREALVKVYGKID